MYLLGVAQKRQQSRFEINPVPKLGSCPILPCLVCCRWSLIWHALSIPIPMSHAPPPFLRSICDDSSVRAHLDQVNVLL